MKNGAELVQLAGSAPDFEAVTSQAFLYHDFSPGAKVYGSKQAKLTNT